MHVQWDGTTLPVPQVRYDTDDISDVGAAVWLYYTLTMGLVTIGVHSVEVVLEKQNPKVASDIVLTNRGHWRPFFPMRCTHPSI